MWESLYKNVFPVSQTREEKSVFSPCSEKQKPGSECVPMAAGSLRAAAASPEPLGWALGKQPLLPLPIPSASACTAASDRNQPRGVRKSWMCGFYWATSTQALKCRKVVIIFPVFFQALFPNPFFSVLWVSFCHRLLSLRVSFTRNSGRAGTCA